MHPNKISPAKLHENCVCAMQTMLQFSYVFAIFLTDFKFFNAVLVCSANEHCTKYYTVLVEYLHKLLQLYKYKLLALGCTYSTVINSRVCTVIFIHIDICTVT